LTAWNLIQGESLQVLASLPDKCVDLVVTSPPYNILHLNSGIKRSGFTRFNKWVEKVENGGYEDDIPEPQYREWVRGVLTQCLRVSRGLVWFNHQERRKSPQSHRAKGAIHPIALLGHEDKFWQEVIWNRKGGLGAGGNRFCREHQGVYGYLDGNKTYWNGGKGMPGNLCTVWAVRPEKGSWHPCPFPVEIPRRLIAASCSPGGLVLDPFHGSGSTGVAAIESGRRYLGIDLKHDYLTRSRKRLEGEK
jgi:DNA modification methylase